MFRNLLHRVLGRRLALSLRSYLALLLLAVLPLVGLGVYAHRVAASSIQELVVANNLTAATITRELVERDLGYLVHTLVGFSQLPDLVDAVRDGDEEAMRHRLEVLVGSHPPIIRAFVTDPTGLLWSDFPRAPESLGRRFDHRDWYQGLSASWEPYVSEVYRRHAEPQLLLVAIAAPVHDPQDDSILGALVYQAELARLTHLLERVRVGNGGFLLLLDHRGRVAAHPRLDLQAREYDDYRATELLDGADDPGGLTYTDPLVGERMLATALPFEVQGERWTVVAQQPVRKAYAAVGTLAWQIGGAGFLLAIVVGGLGLRLAREHTERRRAERALRRANEALERRIEVRTEELRQKEEQFLHSQKMEAVGRLAGGIAHDFNNVLSVILGYSELALNQMPDDAPFRQEIEEIRSAGERAESLTRQLLAFSRKQVLEPEVLDLNEVVAGMDRMLRRVIREDVDLVTRLSPDLGRVEFDPGRIEQILMNLAVNARDAMPEGGKLTIETRNVELDEDYARTHADAQVGPHVMLAMTDTGVGMDQETRARLFEPFFTTKERDKGTGLGLATVYGIVKQSGGNIWVYTEEGRGTTFKVYLPRVEETDVAPTPQATRVATAPTGTERILVVEDEPSLRELVVAVLTDAGYSVLEAADADQALELFAHQRGTIDLVLADLVLPGKGGIQLAEELAREDPGIKCIFMSGYTDEAITHHRVLKPGSTFLEKPVRPAALLEKVRQVLGSPDVE